MTDSSSAGVTHVSDTALWVAIYRAMESERPDAIFRDPHARRLAGGRGQAIVDAMPSGKRMAWPMIVRTAVMDEIILRCVGQGATTVLNLAAGLDTRAYRLKLPPQLLWYHVDFPDMIAYVRERMAGETACCRLEYEPADLTQRADRDRIFAKAGAGGGPALVITEGLLVYLTRDTVAELAVELHRQPAIRWWLTDLASPRLMQMLKRWRSKLEQGNAPMQFAPAEGTAFFGPHGWRETEFRSTWTESLRLKRSVPGAGFWNLLGTLRGPKARDEAIRMSGTVLFEHDG
jgi:methyltransferase (TIGR00027 family)